MSSKRCAHTFTYMNGRYTIGEPTDIAVCVCLCVCVRTCIYGTTISCSLSMVSRTPVNESKFGRSDSCRPLGVLCTSTTYHLSSSLMQFRTVSVDMLSAASEKKCWPLA